MGTIIIIIIILAFSIISSTLIYSNAVNGSRIFNVVDYGAVGDADTDDSSAFSKAWNDLCKAKDGIPTLYIPPRKTFLLKPMEFKGPCKAKGLNIQRTAFLFGSQVMGNVIAPENPKTWDGLEQSVWLSFRRVNGLNLRGSGTIDGRGTKWWDQSCRYHPGKGCTSLAPTAIKFMSCKETHVSGVRIEHSAQTHVLVYGSDGFYIDKVSIQSPGDSPNTDGIHIQRARHVRITNSQIAAGDDCISIGDHTSDIIIDNIRCGPGHGISIGSLGNGGSYVQVEDIHVSNVRFHGTTNGARIKTWQVGRGYARGISFKQLNFTNVENPIIIDQYYCNVRGGCGSLKTGVHISDVSYEGISGTSSTRAAITLNCSQAVACTQMRFKSVDLRPFKSGDTVTADCINAHGEGLGTVQPNIPCLKQH